MVDDLAPESQSHCLDIAHVVGYRRVRGRDADEPLRSVPSRYSYEMKLGRLTIRLRPIEFRILRFLAARPYRACTRQRIAKAVSTRQHPVAPEALDRHIARLRQSLGFFHDYIQKVPYIGYRFRA